MGLGVANPAANPDVPGTVTMSDGPEHSLDDTTHLKRHVRRGVEIILVPQPSDDPNDPLNWPYGKKLTCTLIIFFAASLCAGCTGPILNAGFFVLSVEFDRPISDLAVTSGYQLLVAGASGPFVAAFATKYGKRPLFLSSTLACLVGTIVLSCATTYRMLLVGRVVQGLALAPYESLIFPYVSDVFFVHERGLWTTVMTFSLTAISNLTSIVAGKIMEDLGWHYLFHILNACIGLALVLLYLFVPETAYVRKAAEHSAVGPANDQKSAHADEKQHNEFQTYQAEAVGSTTTTIPKKTFWQELAIFTGSYSDESFLRLIAAPFVVCSNISALWTILITAVLTSVYVAMAFVTAQLFAPPPYLLTPESIGYMSLGPFVGALVGSLAVGLFLDPLTLRMVKANGGVFEPEFRLPLTAVGLTAAAGLFGFGALSSAQGNIYAITFMWGLTLFGVTFVLGPCSAYAMDAFRDLSNQIFIANIMIKNFLFYGYSYFVNTWTAEAGPGIPFYTFGAISLGFIATTVITYVLGKRYRHFWHHHNIMAKFGLVSLQ